MRDRGHRARDRDRDKIRLIDLGKVVRIRLARSRMFIIRVETEARKRFRTVGLKVTKRNLIKGAKELLMSFNRFNVLRNYLKKS